MEQLIIWLVWLRCLLTGKGMMPNTNFDIILLDTILKQAFETPMPKKHELLKKNLNATLHAIRQENRRIWEIELLRKKYNL